jgi:hypothetical protein
MRKILFVVSLLLVTFLFISCTPKDSLSVVFTRDTTENLESIVGEDLEISYGITNLSDNPSTTKVILTKPNDSVKEFVGGTSKYTIPGEELSTKGVYTVKVTTTVGDISKSTPELPIEVVSSINEVYFNEVPADQLLSLKVSSSKTFYWDVSKKLEGRTYSYDVDLKVNDDDFSSLAEKITEKSYTLSATDLETPGVYQLRITPYELSDTVAGPSAIYEFQVANEAGLEDNHFPTISSEATPITSDVSWISSTQANGATINFEWEASDEDGDTLEYGLYINDAFITSTTDKSITISGFAPETSYEWFITATDSKGFETKGPVNSFTTKANSAPSFVGEITKEESDIVKFNWDATDPDNDEIFYEIYDGETLINDSWPQGSYNFALKDIDLKVIAKDPFGLNAEKTLSYTAPSVTSVTDNATINIYVTDSKSGPIVEGAEVVVMDQSDTAIATETTDAEGMVIVSIPNIDTSEKFNIEIKKSGYAKTKIEGLKVYAEDEIEKHFTLSPAELNGDPTTTNYPTVDIKVYDYAYYTTTEDPTKTYADGDTISGPVVVEVHSSTDYLVTNVIYASFDKMPGSSYMTGNRGYVSNSDELLWPANTYHYLGETPLNVVVYDSNGNQIVITKYFNIISNVERYADMMSPEAWADYGLGTNIDSYSRSNSKLGFYSDDSPILKNRENKIKILNNKFGISLNNELKAAPENGNLWNEVWYIPFSAFGYPTELLPNGYNVYRSFDNKTWEKVGYEEAPASGVIRDYSPKLEPGKEVHYQVTSVYSDGESAPTYLGSVTPLPGFRVELTSPSMNATDVSRTPDFQWKPIMDEDVAVTDNAEFTYYAFIYDMVHTSQYIYPVYEEEGLLYIDPVTTTEATPVTMTWEDYDWLLNGIGYINNLEANKAYSWAVDLAIAEVSDSDSYAISIAIDEGWGIDPFGGVDASVFNTFITGSEF